MSELLPEITEDYISTYKLESPTEKNISMLKNVVMQLYDEIKKLKAQQLVKELQLDAEIVEKSVNESTRYTRTKKGMGYIPLLESEIRLAQEKTYTAAAAARFLRVHYTTYKKYAKLFGLWKTNQHYSQEHRYVNVERGKYPLSKILAGEYPDYPVYRLKDKLIRGGYKKPECEQCGYNERRITDNKIPLMLNFEDGNHRNHKLENLKILCYNCTFCSGTVYMKKGKKYNLMDDPDRAQGAIQCIPSRF